MAAVPGGAAAGGQALLFAPGPRTEEEITMAHLIRPWQVRYVDRQGKRCPKDAPGAKRVRERARKWYGCAVPGYSTGKRVPLASDKNVARQMLAELVRRGERGEAGLRDRVADARTVPLSNHLDGFERHLRALAGTKGRPGEKQIRLVLTRLRKTFDACGFAGPDALDAAAVRDYLADRRTLPTDRGGLSIQTANFYLSALSQFCRWMVREKRLAENPFADAERGNPDLDPRHRRRNLEPAELERVLAATAASDTPFRGLTGRDRHALYLTACGTGFRAQELASLAPESFVLGHTPPVVRLGAKFTKNRRPVTQPLPPAVVAVLRDYLADRPAGKPVWPGTWWEKAARMLGKDLAAVGIAYKVRGPDGDLYADFHGLRHTFIAMLDRAGATPNAAKELARHGDLRLTYDTYGHTNLASLGEAVGRLPLPGNDAATLPTYEQLALALVAVLTAWNAVVAPRVAPPVAPDNETVGEGTERPGMKSAG